MPMKPGMVFTIEPILAAGKPETFIWQEDDWTVATVDGKRCVIRGLWFMFIVLMLVMILTIFRTAQFEHEIMITENGAEILTVVD